jgi:uncharacterized protein YbjT (DUF2867 family)
MIGKRFMYAVTGATGKTGLVVAEELLKAGKEVIALGRDEDKLAQLEAAGAEVYSGDLLDKKFAEDTLKGARAAYIMIPQNFSTSDYRDFSDRFRSRWLRRLLQTASHM